MNFVCNVYDRYWKEEDTLIGYLLTDCIMAIAYEEYEDIREMMDAVPTNNLGIFYFLEPIANEACSYDAYKSIMADTYIHKLTYKMNYRIEIDGRKTYIGWLLNE